MSKPCKTSRLKKPAANLNSETRTIDVYKADELGAPFDVYLLNSVKQTFDFETGEVLSTTIPNPTDLRKEIALRRCLNPRRLSAVELKYIRKLLKISAKDLSKQLGVSAEHLSRCESGERVLSTSAEKLFRIVALNERHSIIDLADSILKHANKNNIGKGTIKLIKNALTAVHENIESLEKDIFNSSLDPVFDPDDRLEFYFELNSQEGRFSLGVERNDGRWAKMVGC